MTDDMHDTLTAYLKDAHSIEEQALQQLRRAPEAAGEPELERILREHLRETEGHERRVRELLEERGASPSRLKDTVMKAGGEGMVLFARAQTDTPGKLAAHALSYEALEWASYDLLARTAERAGETRVAEAARSIREEERAMMERIEGLLERTADASLEAAASDDVHEHLKRYLADAHALEAQSIQLLEAGQKMVDGTLKEGFRQHLLESRKQQDTIEFLLEEVDGSRSLVKDVALRLAALNWGTFFGVQPDTPGKLAAFAFAFEHLEIGGYEQLRQVARRSGHEETVRAVSDILEGERRAAAIIRDTFEEVLDRSLEKQGVS